MTQKQKTEFWTGFTTDDSKSYCKQLQKYGMKRIAILYIPTSKIIII